MQGQIAHAPMRRDPLVPGFTSLEISLVSSLLPVQMTRRHANVFVSLDAGVLNVSVDQSASPGTSYQSGLQALLAFGAGAELGILPQLPLTGQVQVVFSVGKPEPDGYLRFGLGALWRIR